MAATNQLYPLANYMSLLQKLPLAIEQSKIIGEKFQKIHSLMCTNSFANLYLLRKKYDYELLVLDNYLFISGLTHDKERHLLLTEPLEKGYYEALLQVLQETQIKCLFPFKESDRSLFDSIPNEMLFKEEDSDYLYNKEKFIHYAGNHLRKKHNLVQQFYKMHTVESAVITNQHVPLLIELLNTWQNEFDELTYEKSADKTDYYSCIEAFNCLEALNLQGRIIFRDGLAIGFVLGEIIANQCYLAHFAKTLKTIKGAYQFILQDLAKHLPESVQWINLEEDLGIEGLRRSKHSYEPDELLKKWRLVLLSSD